VTLFTDNFGLDPIYSYKTPGNYKTVTFESGMNQIPHAINPALSTPTKVSFTLLRKENFHA